MLLNLVRASLLTWIAAKDGVAAIAEYQDEAGFTVLLICTGLCWVAAWLLNRGKKPPQDAVNAPAAEPPVADAPAAAAARRVHARANRFGLLLIVWLVAVESGVAGWYHVRESQLKPAPDWTVHFPTNNPTFATIPMTDKERILLQFDEGKKGQWDGKNGTTWQAFYFNWNPGRVAGYLAKRHTPDVCLTAVGLKMVSDPNLFVVDVKGVKLPMRHYVFQSDDGPLEVYQCRWDAGEAVDSYTADESSRFNLIRAVWAGRGNQGQKVLEIILGGYPNAAEARQALVAELPKLIEVKKQ
jgi:hypothetical protein